MVRIQPEVSQDDLAALADAIRQFQHDTGQSAEQAVMFAAVKVAASGRADSKPAKRNRESITNPEWKQARGSFAWARNQQRRGQDIPPEAKIALAQLNNISPYFIRFLSQTRPPHLSPSWEKKDPRRQIKRVTDGGTGGLAKHTWNVMTGKLNAMREGAGNFRGKNFRVSKYKEQLGNEAGAVVARLINRLSYLEDAYPGITGRAITKGSRALIKEGERLMAKAARRANR